MLWNEEVVVMIYRNVTMSLDRVVMFLITFIELKFSAHLLLLSTILKLLF